MEYLPQADKWIKKQKAIEVNAARTRSQSYKRHRYYPSHKHQRRHSTRKQRWR